MTDKTMMQVCEWHRSKAKAARLDPARQHEANEHESMADAITHHLSQPAERGEAVATVRETSSGPILLLHGIEVTSWLGNCHNETAHALAEKINSAAPPPAAGVPDVKAMVDRFLSWRLPDDFHPDGGISFTHVTRPEWTHDNWPTGTNLFHAGQAEQMIRHMLSATPSPAIGDAK